MWFFNNATRFSQEQEELRKLEAEVDWLQIHGWRIEPTLHFCVEADITAAGRAFPVVLRYSLNFPFTPPSVLPRVRERWSDHQYGRGGELCLEHGPDNWRQDLTGADMLRSAERLLREQEPVGEGPHDAVPSRHETTAGQDLRGNFVRLLVTEPSRDFWRAAPAGQTFRVMYRTLLREESYVVVPSEISRDGDVPWVDTSVPAALERFGHQWNGLALALPEAASVPDVSTGAELKAHLATHGLSAPAGYVPDAIEWILVHVGTGPELFWVNKDDTLTRHRATILPSGGQRLDPGHLALAAKTVAIVGCGSVGAKIGTMLARSGVRSFVLIDDDVLTPENLVRHELDWASMGEHKVDALARRLALVSPGATCKLRRQRLGGQESSGFTDWSLALLRDCDLIVDATANPQVFNLLSSVAQVAERALVWAEVFAGGIGGMIARARPALDPDPQTVRARVDAWCVEKGVLAPTPGTRYDGRMDGVPLIADDADVTTIAAHAARMCIDTLLGRTPSWFPVSAYFIGLAREWLFSQPFHTWPVDVGGPVTPAQPEAPPDPAHIQAIIRLMTQEGHEPSSSP